MEHIKNKQGGIHMSFSNLFISYKIGLKDIKNTIPWAKLPRYRKVFIIIFFIGIIGSSIMHIFLKKYFFSFLPIGISLIIICIFLIIDSKKNNLKTMLKEHYIPYSKKRENMIVKILKEYNIDFENPNLLDMLINEAQYAQVKCDYISQLKKPLKMLSSVIIPIIVYVTKKIGDTATQSEMIKMATSVIAMILLIFSLMLFLEPIVKYLFYRDYYKYDELIYDLRQIKLFYTKKSNQ